MLDSLRNVPHSGYLSTASPAREGFWGTIKMKGERGILAGASELEGTSRRAAKLSLHFTEGETEAQRGSVVSSKSRLVSDGAGPPPALQSSNHKMVITQR